MLGHLVVEGAGVVVGMTSCILGRRRGRVWWGLMLGGGRGW